jgi:ABC-type transport system substrate-binding protein
LGNPALPGYYRPFFAANGVMNNTGYSSEAFERALADYERAFTTESAKKALWQMEQTLAADLPYLLLYTPQITEIFRSDRVSFDLEDGLGGLQARLGGIGEVEEVDATLAR